jgi:hypothetical protein
MYHDHDNVCFGSKMGYIIQTFVFKIDVLRFNGIIIIKNFVLNFFLHSLSVKGYGFMFLT